MSTTSTTNTKNGVMARQAEPRASSLIELKLDLIRRRAYEIFLARNGGPGDHVSDWLQAEQELNGASQRAPSEVRAGERRGRDARSEVKSPPIRDGILDNH